MTITTTSLGPNSGYVAYTAGETLANLISAVEAFIIAHGWSLHDGNSSTFRVYKSSIANASTFKYLSLEWSASNYMTISVYEGWNATTHVGTNSSTSVAATTPNGYRSQSVDLSGGGYVYIFATPRYLIFLNRIVSTGSWGNLGNNTFSGCVEFSLDTGETYGTYPNFALVSSLSLMGDTQIPKVLKGFPNGANNNTSPNLMSMSSLAAGYNYFGIPRTTSNTTGSSAEAACNLSVFGDRPAINSQNFVAYGGQAGSSAQCYVYQNGVALATCGYAGVSYAGLMFITAKKLTDLLPTGNNPNTGLPWCFTPTVIEMDSSNVNNVKAYRGRMYGLKIAGMGKGWSMLDTLNANVDSDLFHVSTGTSHQHLYLGNNFIIPN